MPSASYCWRVLLLRLKLASAVLLLGSCLILACRKTSSVPQPGLARATEPGSCIQDVLVGGDNVCFLVSAGYYICRGDTGALGDGEMTGAPPELRDRLAHEWIAQPKRFANMQLGTRGACGLDAEQRLWCWGDPGYYGDRAGKGVPIEQKAMGLADDFAFGGGLCARRGDAVKCRGMISLDPVAQIAGLPSGVRQLGAAANFGCAATSHEVYCWGRTPWANNHGSPHVSANDRPLDLPSTAAVRIAGPDLDIAKLQLGVISGCVLTQQGKVYCFGSSDYGTWGNGVVSSCQEPCPEHDFRALHEVTALGSDVKELSVGTAACALKKDGSVWCWGSNSSHLVSSRQVSADSLIGKGQAPSPWVVEPEPVEQTALGRDNVHVQVAGPACVTKASGRVWCWGPNGSSAIGNCPERSWCAPTEMKVPCPPRP